MVALILVAVFISQRTRAFFARLPSCCQSSLILLPLASKLGPKTLQIFALASQFSIFFWGLFSRARRVLLLCMTYSTVCTTGAGAAGRFLWEVSLARAPGLFPRRFHVSREKPLLKTRTELESYLSLLTCSAINQNRVVINRRSCARHARLS